MKTTRAILLILICLTATTVLAVDLQSSDPGAIQKHSGDMQEYYRMEKLMKDKSRPVDKAQVEDKTPKEAAEKQSGSARIAIRSIVTDPSEILSDEELREITDFPEGQLQTLDDLFGIVDQINALYRSKGFITAKALLPPQKVEAGVVRIRLVEGRVGDVVVEGNDHTKDSFFIRRISLENGDLVRLDILKKDLVHFNAVNDVGLRATIRPGKNPGDTDLVLKAMEPRNYEVSLLSDNAGSKSVGDERIGLRLVNYSLLGYRDPVTLSGYLSEGARTLSAGYSFPLNSLGTRLSAGYGLNQVDIKSGPFADLDVGGDSYSYNVNINHPLIFSPASTMNLFAGYQYNNSTTDFAGVTISRTKIDSIPVGFDFKRLDDYGLWYCRNTFTYGSERGDEGSDFLLYNLDVIRTLVHTDEIFTFIRGNGQLSSHHPLASTEQFQVGGLSSVRGYPEGFLVGDEGYFLSAEIKFPVPFSDREVFGVNLREKIKGAVFVDHGAAFPYRGTGVSSHHEDFITGAGVGLSMNFSKRLSGKVDIGAPLSRHGENIDSFRIHFTLQSIVF